MKIRIMRSAFIFIGFIIICVVTLLIIKNSAWAGKKCENSGGYSEFDFKFGESVLDDDGNNFMQSNYTGGYIDKSSIIEISVDCSSLTEGSIKLVIARIPSEEAFGTDIIKEGAYSVINEYDIPDVGKYNFMSDNMPDGWYIFFVCSDDNVDKAEGTIRISDYRNNWDNLMHKLGI